MDESLAFVLPFIPGVRLVRTGKQKDNVAKFFWDMAKVAMTLFVIGPFASPERVGIVGAALGLVVTLALAATAYMIDGTEVSQ
jgi:hypothetical protein